MGRISWLPLLMSLVLVAKADDPAFPDTPQEFGQVFVRPVNAGMLGRLQARSGDKVFVGLVDDVIAERDKLYVKDGRFSPGDADAQAALIRQKQGLLLANGTKVQVIGSFLNTQGGQFATYSQVKVQSGPTQGRAVWVSGSESFEFDVCPLKPGEDAFLTQGRSTTLLPGLAVTGDVAVFNEWLRSVRDGEPKANRERLAKSDAVGWTEPGTRVKVQVVACSADRIQHFGLAGPAVRVAVVDGPNAGKVGWALPEAVVRGTSGDPLDPAAKPDAAPGWRAVRSERGGYTVEFPGPPTLREHQTVNGAQVETLGYRSRDREMLVMTVDQPSEATRKQNNDTMYSLRDRLLPRFGRNVQEVYGRTMKPIGAYQTVEVGGRAETARGETIRISGDGYASGKRIQMVLLAYRASDTTFPRDVVRVRTSFALLGNPKGDGSKPEPDPEPEPEPKPVAAATPLPAPTPVALKWGTEVDPDRDVKLTRAAKFLTMQVPGTPHVLAPERNVMNAPRVMAAMKGDFAATVRVNGRFQPIPTSTLRGLTSRQAGGLLLWKNDGNYLVIQHRVAVDDKDGKGQVVLEGQNGGEKAETQRQAAGDAPITLRVERRGTTVKASYSSDGQTWKDLNPVEAGWATGPVLVGVVALNTSPTPLAVRFEELSVAEPKPE